MDKLLSAKEDENRMRNFKRHTDDILIHPSQLSSRDNNRLLAEVRWLTDHATQLLAIESTISALPKGHRIVSAPEFGEKSISLHRQLRYLPATIHAFQYKLSSISNLRPDVQAAASKLFEIYKPLEDYCTRHGDTEEKTTSPQAVETNDQSHELENIIAGIERLSFKDQHTMNMIGGYIDRLLQVDRQLSTNIKNITLQIKPGSVP